MQLRKTTAGFEPAWKGMEENVGLKIWRIEKFEVGSFVFDNFLTSAQEKKKQALLHSTTLARLVTYLYGLNNTFFQNC